jgi:hypothetical protein
VRLIPHKNMRFGLEDDACHFELKQEVSSKIRFIRNVGSL